jgi:regulator of protease activity HflC (stomatin/prohibitin superfamily)
VSPRRREANDLVSLALFLLVLLATAGGIALWRVSRAVTIIYPPHVGLLYRDGVFVRELRPGRHVRFDPFGRTKVLNVSLAELPVQLAEVTVLSKDQFSFRIGLAPVVKVIDARAYSESQPTIEAGNVAHWMHYTATHAAVQPLISAAAIDAVASRTLTEILQDPALVREAVRARLADAIPGATVEQVLVTSINLPPETRKMFTDVERARMEAQAGLERARGEHAALRVLANAARLVSDNPALANLRLLQAVESSKGATTIIVGDPSLLPNAVRDAAAAKPAKRAAASGN